MAGGLDRLVTGVLRMFCRRLWGYAPGMLPHIVARKGALPALGWFAANMPRFFMTMHVLGPLRTHLSCMVISIYNGCYYCAFGHGHALELIYLRDRGRLFPLDPSTLTGWLDLGSRRIAHRMREVLQGAGLQAEAQWVDCTLGLLSGDQHPVDRAEMRLAHLVRMIGAMNAIATAAEVEPDGAQNAINKDLALKERNAALRQAH